MKIKICGITNFEDAEVCAKEKIDFIGFNFYKGSKRFVEPKTVKKIIKRLERSDVRFVGVFVNEEISKIRKIAGFCSLNAVQLHGDEDHSYVNELREAFHEDIKIIKAVRVKDRNSLKNLEVFKADYLLLDSFRKNEFGGTGKTFDYSLLKNIKSKFFIAGGLSIKNIKKTVTVKPYGVDINSKIEIYPGKKDYKKLKKIIEVIRNEIKY